MKVISASNYNCEPDWTWDRRQQPFTDWDLWFITAGEGSVQLNRQRQPVSGGTVAIFRPGDTLYARHNPKRPLTVYAIHFETIISLPTGSFFEVTDPPFLESLAMRLLGAERAGDQGTADFWLTAIIRTIQDDQVIRSPPESPEAAVRQQAAEIKRNPAQPWRVTSLAKCCHICPDHFTRIFRRLYGMPPRQYITQQRIAAATGLLCSTHFTISDIAYKLGYGDVYLFSRLFKRIKGTSPGHYRKAYRV